MLEEYYANPSDGEVIKILHQRLDKIKQQNIKLRKALKDCISENCYYHEDECNLCTIGLLGQCKIPEAARLLEECSINLSEKKEV